MMGIHLPIIGTIRLIISVYLLSKDEQSGKLEVTQFIIYILSRTGAESIFIEKVLLYYLCADSCQFVAVNRKIGYSRTKVLALKRNPLYHTDYLRNLGCPKPANQLLNL